MIEEKERLEALQKESSSSGSPKIKLQPIQQTQNQSDNKWKRKKSEEEPEKGSMFGTFTVFAIVGIAIGVAVVVGVKLLKK